MIFRRVKAKVTAICYLFVNAFIAPFSIVYATDDGHIAELQSRARQQQIWRNEDWLNLLHYRDVGGNGEAFESEVNDDRFVIAADGNTNPESELLATIAAFYRTCLLYTSDAADELT